jgi:hypothetical protein
LGLTCSCFFIEPLDTLPGADPDDAWHFLLSCGGYELILCGAAEGDYLCWGAGGVAGADFPGLSLAFWLMVICLLLLTVGGGPFVARGGGEKMLISYNSAVFDVVSVTVAHQQVSPPPVGRSAM